MFVKTVIDRNAYNKIQKQKNIVIADVMWEQEKDATGILLAATIFTDAITIFSCFVSLHYSSGCFGKPANPASKSLSVGM